MTADLTNAQLGDKITLEVEFARHGNERMIVVAHGHGDRWVHFPVPISAIAKHEPALRVQQEKDKDYG